MKLYSAPGTRREIRGCCLERPDKWKKQVIDSLIVRSHEKRNMAVEVANPYLGSTRVEVQSSLFVDFGARNGRGNNLNRNFWCPLEEGETADVLRTLKGELGSKSLDAGSRAVVHEPV